MSAEGDITISSSKNPLLPHRVDLGYKHITVEELQQKLLKTKALEELRNNECIAKRTRSKQPQKYVDKEMPWGEEEEGMITNDMQ